MTFLSKKTTRTPLFKNTKEESPSFLLKLYDILDAPKYSDIIQWDPTGTMIIMKKSNSFTENILPLYYKHSNYSSFVRQLNMYDFHKKKNNSNEEVFYHAVFNKDNKGMIKTIKRKTIKKKGRQSMITHNAMLNTNHKHKMININDNKDDAGNDNDDVDEISIDIENDVIGKKATKVSIENTLSVLLKKVNYHKERQKISKLKIDDLNEKNEICIKSNNQILKEYVSKTEYKTKLEAIIRLIIEVILTKPQMKPNPGLHEPRSRKTSDALKAQQQALKHNDLHPQQQEVSSVASLFHFLNYKQSPLSSLNQIIAKNSNINIKQANDYLLLSPQRPSCCPSPSPSSSFSLREYTPNMLLSNSPIKSKMTNDDSQCISNEMSCSKGSLFNGSRLSSMSDVLMKGSHTNINRIGEDGSNIIIHSKNMFDFDSDDCIINTVNDFNYNQ